MLRNGETAGVVRLAEGLRHGRDLMPAAAELLEGAGLSPADLWAVSVSAGPGSYTGARVGVMSAKALAYGCDCLLAGVSSLAALAATLGLANGADEGDLVMTVQDARRDEVYAGVYRLENGDAVRMTPDAALAPEEAAERLAAILEQGRTPRLIGSGFATYRDLFAKYVSVDDAAVGIVNPEAVGRLGWRQLLREESADPLLLQPVYLRRDADADWRRDWLIDPTVKH